MTSTSPYVINILYDMIEWLYSCHMLFDLFL